MIQQEIPPVEEDHAAAGGEERLSQSDHAHEHEHDHGTCPRHGETAFRPLTRTEQRNLWMQEFGGQDVALQTWVQLVEKQDLELTMMFQMHGLLVFGTMVNTARYTEFYLELNETLHREQEPLTANMIRAGYLALMLPQELPEIGADGLPVVLHYVHLRDVTIISAGHKIQVPFWRGKIREVEAFVMGATATATE